MTIRPNLNKLSNEIYLANVAKGFHDKKISNDTLLMLIVTELSEAVEADRKNKRADLDAFEKNLINDETLPISFTFNFEIYIKDSIEDELADTVIRLLDLSGLRKYLLSDAILLQATVAKNKSFPENIFAICKDLVCYRYSETERILYALLNIERLCNMLEIDLWKHVKLKMNYNSFRTYKHCKYY